jgi:hypothetical protein
LKTGVGLDPSGSMSPGTTSGTSSSDTGVGLDPSGTP